MVVGPVDWWHPFPTQNPNVPKIWMKPDGRKCSPLSLYSIQIGFSWTFFAPSQPWAAVGCPGRMDDYPLALVIGNGRPGMDGRSWIARGGCQDWVTGAQRRSHLVCPERHHLQHRSVDFEIVTDAVQDVVAPFQRLDSFVGRGCWRCRRTVCSRVEDSSDGWENAVVNPRERLCSGCPLGYSTEKPAICYS